MIKVPDFSKLSNVEVDSLLKLTEGVILPEDETPFEMYKPASEILDVFYHSKANIRIISGGNRSSKTVSSIVDLISHAIGRFPPSLSNIPITQVNSCRIVTVDKDHGIEKIIMPKIFKYTPREEISRYDAEHSTLYLKNGGLIEVVTYQQRIEQHGGVSRDYVLMDEEPPHEVFVESLMRVADCGGKITLAFTPIGEDSWISDDLVDKAHIIYRMEDKKVVSQTNLEGLADLEFFQVYSKDNYFIADWTSFDRIINLLTPEQILQRTKGELTFSSGKVFPMFSDKHIIKPFNPPGPDHPTEPPYPVFVALDPHPRIPHAVLFMTATPSGTLIVFDELFVDGGVESLVSQIKEKEKGKWIAWRRIDPSASAPDMIDRGKSLLIELIKKGLFFSKGSKDLDSGIIAIREKLLNNSLMVCSNCKMTIKELQKLKWSKTRHEKPVDKDDHFVEDLRRLILAGAGWLQYLETQIPLENWRRYS